MYVLQQLINGLSQGSIYAMMAIGYTLIVGVIFNFIMGVTASRLMLKSISKFKPFKKAWLYGGDK